MLAAFIDASNPPLSGSERDACQKVVKEAIDMLRPAAEAWAVTVDKEAAMTRFDFERDTDAPRSFTVATDGDDDEHSTTFSLVCHFLLAHWPNDSQRKPS